MKKRIINFFFPKNDEYKKTDTCIPKMIDVESGYVKPFGLPNIGNTCYMNSSLQCLLSLPKFIENIDILISGSKNPKLLILFQKLAQKQDISVLSEIKRAIAQRNETFYGFSQHDSYEFTISLIDLLNDENEKEIDDLFIGSFNLITECRNCYSKIFMKQTYSSINLSIRETFRVRYVPFLLTQNIIRMPQKPIVSSIIKTQKFFNNKITINQYVFMAKINKKYEIIDKISKEYTEIYAFELPAEVKEGYGLIIIQLKTDDKRPITSPFLCEIPVNGFYANELQEIIYDRLADVNKGTFTKSSMTFSKPIFSKFTFSEHYPILKEHLTIIVNDQNSFNFERRSEISQDVDLNLIELFNGHISQTQIEPPCKWTCDDCGKKTRVLQRTKYDKLPEILIFQIKRSSDTNSSLPDQTRVSFPSEVTIKIDDNEEYNQIFLNKNNGLRYELRSISHHSGSFDGGHYWAWGKRGQKWFSFNDTSTDTLVDDPFKPTSSAYVAFYEKVPLKPREKILVKVNDTDVIDDAKKHMDNIKTTSYVLLGLLLTSLLFNYLRK